MHDELMIRIVEDQGRYQIHCKQRLHIPQQGQVVECDLTHKPPRLFDARPFLDELPNIRREMFQAIQTRQTNDESLRNHGRRLFDALFGGNVGQELQMPLAAASGKGFGLRIRLDLPRELQAIPWELMCRTDWEPGDFLCLDRSFELVRSKFERLVNQNPQINLPLKILVVVSSPLDLPPIGARAEIDRLLTALDELIREGRVQLDFIHGADTERRMDAELRTQRFHVLHFVGHGEAVGTKACLIFEDEKRCKQHVSSEHLFRQLGGPNRPQLVVLSACEGAAVGTTAPGGFGTSFASVADGVMLAGVAAVVAYQFLISDQAATVIAGELYSRLADGYDIGSAISSVRNSGMMQSSVPSLVERFTPVLFLNTPGGTMLNAAGRGVVPHQNCFPLMRQSSQEAERSRHFSQALDYALTAARINAADDDNLKAIDRLRWEESLGAALHDAQYCESIKDWSGALTALEAFERAFLQSNRPEGSQRQHHSAEYDRAQQRRAVLRAGLGDCDPLLAWTE